MSIHDTDSEADYCSRCGEALVDHGVMVVGERTPYSHYICPTRSGEGSIEVVDLEGQP